MISSLEAWMRTLIATGFIVVLFTSSVASAQAVPKASEVVELQKQARARMRNIEYELAIPLLERALTSDLSQPQKAELQADLGISYANLGDTERAHAAFDAALRANALLDLPVGTSPKIRKLFDELRARGAKASAPLPSIVVAPSEPVGSLVKPIDFVMGGAVVAGVIAGVITGVVSSNAAGELQSGLHDRATVDSLSSRQRLYAIASVSSYAAAGAAAITELALILFMNRRADSASVISASAISVSASLLPTGGAAAAFRIRF
jgi:tetratricopeptide (TPR) repeat protein